MFSTLFNTLKGKFEEPVNNELSNYIYFNCNNLEKCDDNDQECNNKKKNMRGE